MLVEILLEAKTEKTTFPSWLWCGLQLVKRWFKWWLGGVKVRCLWEKLDLLWFPCEYSEVKYGTRTWYASIAPSWPLGLSFKKVVFILVNKKVGYVQLGWFASLLVLPSFLQRWSVAWGWKSAFAVGTGVMGELEGGGSRRVSSFRLHPQELFV